jgi:hypothetical protein
METREKDYTFAVLTRDELMKEKTLLMEKLKDMEEREKKKVNDLDLQDHLETRRKGRRKR